MSTCAPRQLQPNQLVPEANSRLIPLVQKGALLDLICRNHWH